ncbi:hypothetical protein ACYF6T_38970 [Streptomyces sp. 7R007]
MPTLGFTALGVAALAVVVLLCGARDSWFFSLLSLAWLIQGASEAYQEHRTRTLGCLLAGAFLVGAAFRALLIRRAPAGGGT